MMMSGDREGREKKGGREEGGEKRRGEKKGGEKERKRQGGHDIPNQPTSRVPDP